MMDQEKITRPKHVNRLAKTKSPYLLQHAGNPVEWYPWGDEAFKKASDEDKPVFLSIGYATCHWCHVMAHESFEDQEVAGLLNKHFVSIKVDREERPDIDHIYMTACQVLTGRGGWPLSIFMTAEGKPFFAGTYFPTRSRMGMPGFIEVLSQLVAMWKQDRERLLASSEAITNALKETAKSDGQPRELVVPTLKHAYEQFRKSFDSRWGGFGAAPKFPTPHNLTFLLRWYRRSGDSTALQMVEKTLLAMRRGGIFDHIGLGFHRYSVDERWLLPHFEKMLYDQALLALAYTEAYQVTRDRFYSQVTREIFSYVIRDMTAPEGGFYSAEDADSEGQEGLFYVWKPEEIKEHLGREQGALFCRFYNITESGNFEHGRSIPHLTETVESFGAREGIALKDLEETLRESRARLFAKREERVHPLKDDKILTAWNGLMIAAMAHGSRALGDKSYAEAARRSADFVLGSMRDSSGRLYRRYRDGDLAYSGFLEDYAFLVWGLIELYEATFDVALLEEAVCINEEMVKLFWDAGSGGFYFSGQGNQPLIAQSKDVYDGATPSGNSVAATNLLRLSRLTGNSELETKTGQIFTAFSQQISAHPMAYTHFLSACDFYFGPSQEIVVAGDVDDPEVQEMVACIHQAFLPNKALLFRRQDAPADDLARVTPFVKDMKAVGDKATTYWCENFSCREPITEIEALKRIIAEQ